MANLIDLANKARAEFNRRPKPERKNVVEFFRNRRDIIEKMVAESQPMVLAAYDKDGQAVAAKHWQPKGPVENIAGNVLSRPEFRAASRAKLGIERVVVGPADTERFYDFLIGDLVAKVAERNDRIGQLQDQQRRVEELTAENEILGGGLSKAAGRVKELETRITCLESELDEGTLLFGEQSAELKRLATIRGAFANLARTLWKTLFG